MWGRQTDRLSEIDLAANAADGHGVDWPIRYADLAPWYDHVERFAGISGKAEGLPQLPDSNFLPPMPLTAIEKDFQARLGATYPTRRMTNGRCAHLTQRSEEHTSELQSLMRISYAVFCLKKNKTHTHNEKHEQKYHS